MKKTRYIVSVVGSKTDFTFTDRDAALGELKSLAHQGHVVTFQQETTEWDQYTISTRDLMPQRYYTIGKPRGGEFKPEDLAQMVAFFIGRPTQIEKVSN